MLHRSRLLTSIGILPCLLFATFERAVASPSSPAVTPLLQAARVSTPLEQQVVAEINRARTNPAVYADWLQTQRSHYSNFILSLPGENPIRTREGVAALDEAIAFLQSIEPLPPLTLSAGMSQAATDHAIDMGLSGGVGSTGSDGSTASDRMAQYGSRLGEAIELSSYGKNTAEAIVLLLIVNDGFSDRPFRTELFNSSYRFTGAACASHITQRSICVLNYATQFNEGTINAAPPTATALNRDHFAGLEAEITDETNLLRSNPSAYADLLAELRQYYSGNLLRLPNQLPIETQEGVAALDEAIAELRQTAPLPILTASRSLSQGARDHVRDQRKTGRTGHYGSDGSDPFVRLDRYGDRIGLAGENISYSPINNGARWHIMQLLIDDGVLDRGHRRALLNTEYRLTGAACGRHPDFREICVMTYAAGFTAHPENEVLPRSNDRSN